MKARYNIEEDYDYLYLEASTDGGQSWTALDGTVNGEPFSRDGSGTPAIDGYTDGAWVDLNVPLDAVAGKVGAVPAPLPHRRWRLRGRLLR